MPLKLASKTQVSGHFFVRRRLAFALLRRSVSMEINPVRWHRTLLVLSAVLGVVLVVGAFVYGWFRPAGTIDASSKIVTDRSSGALFVVVGGRLHPALNLVSAQLIAGSPDRPTFVSSAQIAEWPKGPAVGIAGAPVQTPTVLSPQVSRWAVCDAAAETLRGVPVVTGIDGQLALGQGAAELGGAEALLLSYGQQVYVVANGVRMPVDVSEPALAGPLGISAGAAPTAMSEALFDALPAGIDWLCRSSLAPVVLLGWTLGRGWWSGLWWLAVMSLRIRTGFMWCWLMGCRRFRRLWLRCCANMIRSACRRRRGCRRIGWRRSRDPSGPLRPSPARHRQELQLWPPARAFSRRLRCQCR
ncbi:type VII secretion protein EccB [Mycobacterium ulcerans str. Harvey]|uniref:Type VII secretion protein EccB n=1 Tax=Mycobacterium ulcerans str. Harvey TaxID=1299332 RepID=A0ABP3A9K9_MYCUL|nr:type VII secretion protein EccB [Mycobacterium ulcerans str. Harvey]